METLLRWIGRIAGCLGVLLCVIAIASRLARTWHLGGFPVGTLLLGGMAAMLVACLAYLASIAERPRP
jgi:hypothetical protein